MIGENPETKPHLNDWLAIAALTLLAFASRLYGLGEWDFRYDEFFTIHHAFERFRSPFNPAYYGLVAGSFSLFGVSEWAARLPAMCLGVISIPVFFVTWRGIIGRHAAMVGAVLLVMSSWHLHYSQFSRYYAGVFLCGSLAYAWYYQAVVQNKRSYLLAAVTANVIGILFHLASAGVAAACGLFSLLIVLTKKDGFGYSKRIATTHIAVYVVAGLIALPFVWQTIVVDWHLQRQFWGYAPAGLLLQLTKWTQIPLAAAGAIGLVLIFVRQPTLGAYFTVAILAPVGALLIGSSVTTVRPEFVFYVLAPTIACAGYFCAVGANTVTRCTPGVDGHLRKWPVIGVPLRWLATNGIAFVIVATMMPEFVSHYTGRKSLDFRDAVAFVEDAYQPGDRILTLVALCNFFPHYARQEYPLELSFGDPYDASVRWSEQLEPYEHFNGRLWVIVQARRRPVAPELESWLLANGSLVWQQFAHRFDYAVDGYQIFQAGRSVNDSAPARALPPGRYGLASMREECRS